MQTIFDQAMNDIQTRKLEIPNGFISFYHHFNIVAGRSDCTCGIFYFEKPKEIEGYEIIPVPKHTVMQLTHQGSYKHLPTGWAKIMAYVRSHGIKVDKNTFMYEIYLNSPKMVRAEDVLTELNLPIK